MKWLYHVELPAAELTALRKLELAKLEALRAIAEQLERLDAQLRFMAEHWPSPPAPTALPKGAIAELAALTEQLAAADTRHAPYSLAALLGEVVIRLRELVGRNLS